MRLRPSRTRRALVAGWFSLDRQGATAGDMRAAELVRGWLLEAGTRCEVALGEPFEGGVRWDEVRPSRYDAVFVVCGPMDQGMPIAELVKRFSGRRLVGVNVTLLQRLDSWNPWSTVLARDGSGVETLPDLSFAAKPPEVPVVARVQVQVESEYQDAAPDFVHAAFDRLLADRDAAVVSIDARLDGNAGGLRTAAQVEALIARADVVLTTRVDGLVFALRAGVPAVAVDPVPDGAKVIAQAEAVGWPYAQVVNELDDASLTRAYEACLGPGARDLARECADRAAERLDSVRRAVQAEVSAQHA
jgi:hypothetical protein